MKVVKSGNTYRITDDAVIQDSLASGTYTLEYAKGVGTFLEKTDDLLIGEQKIYGESVNKSEMVIKAFNHSKRSLGVMYGGPKGTGKTLAVRYLSTVLRNDYGIPTVIVENPVPGMVSFIKSIKQEVLILFDEFEKNFQRKSDDNFSQEDLLGLFDGISQNKHLYVITYNNQQGISEYLIDRPGRFHYNISLGNPDEKTIEEYIKDNTEDVDGYWLNEQIDKVIKLSKIYDLNYDSLRALTFELGLGNSVSEVIKDLNIGKGIMYSNKSYRVRIFNKNDEEVFNSVDDFNLIDGSTVVEDIYAEFRLNLNYSKAQSDGSVIIPAIGIKYRWLSSDVDEQEELLKRYPDRQNTELSKAIITQERVDQFRYDRVI